MTISHPATMIHPGISVSFEFFPPKTEKMNERLWECVHRLAPLSPSFVSVTYGAGGSTRERTHDIVRRLQGAEWTLPTAAHLTCVGAARDEIDEIALNYWESGIRHIVALRGDPPEGASEYQPHPQGYAYAADLVAGLKRIADFEISVAAYPETHPEALSADADVENLKRKIDAGASRSISQMFFDPEVFLRFRDRAVSAGISAPLVPGLLPVTNFAGVANFARRCGSSVPAWAEDMFAGLEDDAESQKLVGASLVANQVRRLVDEGVTDFHFYTLNRADLTYAICRMLGLRDKDRGADQG